MSTDLVQLNNNNAIVSLSDDMTGMDNIRVRPSNIVLVQNTTRDPFGARPGQFLDTLTHEVYDEITLVPLRVSPNRVMFPPGSFGGDAGEPICRSSDGVYPSPFAKVPQAESCAACPNSKWVGKNKPACPERIKMLGIIKDTSLPKYFQFSGMGVKVIKLTLEAIKQDAIVMAKKSGKTYRLFSYYFTLKSQRESNSRGVYYVPRIENLLKVQDPTEFGPLFMEYVVNVVRDNDVDDEEIRQEAQVNAAVDTVVDAQVVQDDEPPFKV